MRHPNTLATRLKPNTHMDFMNIESFSSTLPIFLPMQ